MKKTLVLAAHLLPPSAVRWEHVRSGAYKAPEERALEAALAVLDSLAWELDDPRMTRVSLRKEVYSINWWRDLDARRVGHEPRSWKAHRPHQHK